MFLIQVYYYKRYEGKFFAIVKNLEIHKMLAGKNVSLYVIYTVYTGVYVHMYNIIYSTCRVTLAGGHPQAPPPQTRPPRLGRCGQPYAVAEAAHPAGQSRRHLRGCGHVVRGVVM